MNTTDRMTTDHWHEETCLMINNDPGYLKRIRQIYADSLRLPVVPTQGGCAFLRKWEIALDKLTSDVWVDMLKVYEREELPASKPTFNASYIFNHTYCEVDNED